MMPKYKWLTAGPYITFSTWGALSLVVSSPDIQFFARALWPCRKIGSGHFHYENWGMFTYGGQ